MVKTINPYLIFNGNAEEAFNFYKSVFGGEFSMVSKFKEAPNQENLNPADGDRLIHISLPLGNGHILMASDCPTNMQGYKFTEGNNFNVSIETGSREETKRLFDALSAGGKVSMPLGDQFWGAYFGGCTDKFGIHWMISYAKPKDN